MSGFDSSLEEREGALPRVDRGVGPIHEGARVVEKGMTCVFVDFCGEVDSSGLHGSGDFGQRVDESRVRLTVEGEHRARDRRDRRRLGRHPVKRHSSADARIGRRERKAVTTAEAESRDRDATVDAGLFSEIVNARAERGEGSPTELGNIETGEGGTQEWLAIRPH